MNFAVVVGASLQSGYALPACRPRQRHTTTATGRGSTYQARKPVQTKPASSGRTGKLTDRRMTRTDALRMVWRRAAAGIATELGERKGVDH